MEMAEGFDGLLGALVGLVRTSDRITPDEETCRLVEEGLEILFFHDSEEKRKQAAERLRQKKDRIMPDCAACKNPCGRFSDYDEAELWNGEEKIRSVKFSLLEAMKDLGKNGRRSRQEAVFRGLFAIGEDCEEDWLLAIAEQLKI